MGRPHRSSANGAIVWPLVVAAIALSGWIISSSPVHPILTWAPFVLVALALVAELLPVPLSRHGVRVTFTLPYVAGMAVAVGPTGALAADVAVSLLAAICVGLYRRQPIAWSWLQVNLAVAAICSCSGGFASFGAGYLGLGRVEGDALAALLFTGVYGALNFILVTRIGSHMAGRAFSTDILKTLKVGAIGLTMYALIALAVAVLISEDLVWLVPLTFAPILGLRAALQVKARMYEHYYETIVAMAFMLRRVHPYTHGHLERVARTAEGVGLHLGIPPARARMLREAAILHDIGKIAVDEQVLDKPAKLNPEEWDHVRQHSVYGAVILEEAAPFRNIAPWVRHHHERPDGTGYPDGLRGDDIPIESKIIAVVDAYDAMVGGDLPGERRSYREPMTPEDALKELDRCSGTQFDPEVVLAFRHVLRAEGARA